MSQFQLEKITPIMEEVIKYLPNVVRKINDAQNLNTNQILPYFDNRLEFVIPHGDVDIKITLTRTRAGKRLQYNPDQIMKFYRKAAITIGPKNSPRAYHVNTRFFKGDIVPLKCDLKYAIALDDKYNAFPNVTEKSVEKAIKRALRTRPTGDGAYPTVFTF